MVLSVTQIWMTGEYVRTSMEGVAIGYGIRASQSWSNYVLGGWLAATHVPRIGNTGRRCRQAGIQIPIDSPAEFIPRAVAQAPVLPSVTVSTTTRVAHSDPLPAARGHSPVVIRLPRRYMDVPDGRSAGTVGDNDDNANDGDGDSSPKRPIHDVSYVPDYPTRSSRSGRLRVGAWGDANAVGEGLWRRQIFTQSRSRPDCQAVFNSQLPDPRNVC